uniref:Uncharacterized protein n=1 Tax=Arundo donax TaxID=35708 RepID=A0A0A8ZAC8_ARUDO
MHISTQKKLTGLHTIYILLAELVPVSKKEKTESLPLGITHNTRKIYIVQE